MNKGTGSFTVWENTMCNPLAPAREQARLAWHDGYASAEQTPDYERGFVDGMQEQMKSSVDKVVNAITKPWVGLTPTDMKELASEWWEPNKNEMALIDWAEARLKERNT